VLVDVSKFVPQRVDHAEAVKIELIAVFTVTAVEISDMGFTLLK